MLYIIIIGLILGFIMGLYQGIVMHKPYIRAHAWFPVYHRTWVLVILIAILFGGILFRESFTFQFVIQIIGLISLSWELFEMGYAYTRYWKLIPDKENLIGLNIYIRDLNLQLLHIGRFITGVLFLSFGGVL